MANHRRTQSATRKPYSAPTCIPCTERACLKKAKAIDEILAEKDFEAKKKQAEADWQFRKTHWQALDEEAEWQGHFGKRPRKTTNRKAESKKKRDL